MGRSGGGHADCDAYITREPLRHWMDQAAPSLAKADITLCERRRDWGSAIWPHATAGLFKVKQSLLRILEQVPP